MSDTLAEVAVAIMRHCNEAPGCPFCGADGFEHDEHEPGALCARLQAELDALDIPVGG